MIRVICFISFILFTACSKNERPADNPPSSSLAAVKLTSGHILKSNPLLPKLEEKLWQNLLTAELSMKKGNSSAREEVLLLSNKLSKLHPVKSTKQFMKMGKVTWYKDSNIIEIPARTTSPDSDDYLELLLCNRHGRSHETLLLTDCRPLHLELMLHMAGFLKDNSPSQFRLFVALPGKEIPITKFLLGEDGELPEKLYFSFTGSPFKPNNYQPDLNGDHIQLWERHDAVLQCSDPSINSGKKKILINRKAALQNGIAVKLLLKPE